MYNRCVGRGRCFRTGSFVSLLRYRGVPVVEVAVRAVLAEASRAVPVRVGSVVTVDDAFGGAGGAFG